MSTGMQQMRAMMRLLRGGAERELRGMRLVETALPLLDRVLARYNAVVSLWTDGVITDRRTVCARTGEFVMAKTGNAPYTRFRDIELDSTWDREVAFIGAPPALATQLRRVTHYAGVACVFAAVSALSAEITTMIVWEFVFLCGA